MKNLYLTTALPYANGNLHIGHIFEAVIADIKSRTYTKNGIKHDFISGADCHGSATTIYCSKHNLNIENHLNNQILKRMINKAPTHIEYYDGNTAYLTIDEKSLVSNDIQRTRSSCRWYV